MVERNNVILISIDTLRPDCLGCYGGSAFTSPNIDKIAEMGVLFENAYSVGFMSQDIRDSMLTGFDPWSLGIPTVKDHNLYELAQRFNLFRHRYLPSVLRKEGYQALAVDYLCGWHGAAFDYYSGNLMHKVDRLQRKAHLMATRTRLRQKLFPYRIFERVLGRKPSDSAGRIVSHAIARLESIRQPFFFLLHFWDCHTPFYPPSKYLKDFNNTTTEYNQSIDVLLNSVKNVQEPLSTLSKQLLVRGAYGVRYTDEMVRRYLGALKYLDDQIGRFLSTLASRGLLDNTLLVIAADHGTSFGEHGVYFSHHTLHNEILHVPLIISFPEGKCGRVEAPCQLTDITPTILDYLKLDNGFNFDGLSLMQLVEAGDVHRFEERDIFFGQPECITGLQDINGIIRGRYKYINGQVEARACRFCGLVHHKGEELYDLKNDPREMNNIVEKEKHKAQDLRVALSGFLESSTRHDDEGSNTLITTGT